MDVGMQVEVLPPGMQDREEPDLRAGRLEPAAIVSNVSEAARNRMP